MIVWKAYKLEPQYDKYEKRVMTHESFLKFEITEDLMDQLAIRMKVQRPGHAISYV